ncbi:hypothetical protein SPHINGO391_450141 [Sphingomonas aurantiaca]|uniref:Uncharacterized protein n=2 Tax=Sphingomonas aurantiaca TaxID=185949 RepID=A0A5E7ZGH6_9SPHN|nr:hypothetical protein SPHINGO391_450141 [Sphingomonas aurantiaca]
MPRGFRPLPGKLLRTIRSALLRGEVVASISADVGVGADRIWGVRAEMPEADRQTRTLAIRARRRREGLDGADIIKAVEMAVPSSLMRYLPKELKTGEKTLDQQWTAQSVRAAVVNELYLAVVDGHVEIEQIADVVKSFINRGFRSWSEVYNKRSVSLDANLGTNDSRTKHDMLGDDTAVSEIDDIEIGGGS